MTVEAPVLVKCACGARFELSARVAREHRRHGLPNVCWVCRHPPRPPDPKRLEAMRQWWLDRFTLDELRSWPPL